MDVIELTDIEKDAIGEVMNISMGSAATAASELLNAKVWITTPKVEVMKANDFRQYDKLEPAVCVKIEYVKGLSGSNLMVLRQDDVQMILNQLMGQPLEVSPDFEFDELSISAVSEVMNQMMGASATALSDFLGLTIDISTPTPYIMEKVDFNEVQSFNGDETVAAIHFDLTIDGVIKSEFASVISLELAKFIADRIMGGGMDAPEPEAAPAPAAPEPPPSSSSSGGQLSQEELDAMLAAMTGGAPAAAPAQPDPVQMAQAPQMGGMPQMGMPMGMPQQGMPQMGMPMGMPQDAQYGYPPQYGYQQPYPPYPPQMPYYQQPQPMNVQNAQLNRFEAPDVPLSGDQKTNLQLLMGVPLDISVEIGTAKRKVKDILEFTQGTIIELERQAGAPVDIIVNGNLIAKGDIVVIDDNFAVRITEIMKSKLMDSLNKE